MIKMDDRELTRLADIGAAARPDWSHRSLRAFLANNLASRAYADVAVALVIVAMDERAQTPRLLLEHGPWWSAVGTAFRRQTADVGPGRDAERCRYAGHEHEAADRCRLCAAERAAGDVPQLPAEPAPPPAEITAVAERHRRSATAPIGRRDFGQAAELRPVDNFAGTNCTRCGGYFVDDLDGNLAHQLVFGHVPARPAPLEAEAAEAAR